jgi:GT2 family glycosyltransferase
MRQITVSLLNINQAQLTMDILTKLARLAAHDWAVQLILVDNGSRDEQLQTLLDGFRSHQDRFAEALFIAASRNLGCNGGRNVALKLASAEYILILDNDLILPDDPGWLETLWQRLEDNPQAAIVGPLLVFADQPEVVQVAGLGLTKQGRVGYLQRGEPVTQIPPTPVAVVATLAACWLLRRQAQQTVGLFSDEYYPVQYEDVDLCVRLGLAGWQILCDRSVRIKHIENVTTRNLEDYPFARLTVRQAMRFREKWAHLLPQLATITEEEIYWGSIPRSKN